MGVSISAKNATYSFDMGGGGFFNLRKNIAYALDKDFGENYEQLILCHSKEACDANDREAERIINSKHLDDEYACVLDFLYASDCGGKINYKTCKKIYDLIKDIDFGDKCFRYGILVHNDYDEFKSFLKECYSHRRNMYWS